MNPDTGKIHNLSSEDQQRILGRVVREQYESMEALLARAQKHHEELADGEPVPGSPLPANWPILTEGRELRLVKGFKMVIQSIDVENQTITVKLVRR